MRRFLVKVIRSSFALGLILLVINSFGQSFSFDQEQKIKDAVRLLLNDYGKNGTFSAEGETISEEYIRGFLAVFTNPTQCMVYNDLDLSLKRGAAVTVNEYVHMARMNYPSGLDLFVDSENFTLVSLTEIPKKHQFYEAIVRVNKELFGLSSQNMLHNFKGELYFHFEVHFIDNNLKSITISSINDYTRYNNLIANKRVRGIHLSFIGEPANSQLNSPSIVENGKWKQAPQMGVNFGLGVSWFFNRSFGLSIGAYKTEYKTSFTLNSFSGQSTIQMVDEDNDTYFPVYEITDLKELNTIDYIEIPLMLSFRSGKSRTSLYLDLGMVLAFSLNANYHVEGLVNRMGYYPDYDFTLDNVPEYGFETVVLDNSGVWSVKSNSILAIGRLGLSFPISKSIYLKLGGVIVYGIDDILYNKPKHNEDFISTTGIIPNSTTLMRTGVEVGLSYKLF